MAELLESSDKEKLFREHVSVLSEKKKKQFQKLLEETSEVLTGSIYLTFYDEMYVVKDNIGEFLEEG